MEAELHHATSLLFVYGTLRRDSGHSMSAWLAARAAWLGAATCLESRLYRISWYPALAPGAPGEQVRGDLYLLHDPATCWPGLDAFEAVTGAPDDEYACRPCRVVQADGIEVVARAYWYRLPLAGLEPLPGGDWLRAVPATPSR